MDACDADPYLRRAAKHHGELTNRACPVCKKLKIVELRYAFGDQLGQYSGRIKNQQELNQMQSEYGEFRVYVVEICTSCHWNHLTESFLLGDGKYRKPPRKQRTLADDD
jgi:ssDNA-binding Zn-finger/Zn-ribbon topoisomerase 1